jgi:preprotein translocase subunit SecB
MKSQYQLNFINFVVPKFMFEKKNVESDNFEILPKAVISRKNNQFHINVDVEITNLNNSLVLKMVCVGIFKYNTDDENLLLSFMSLNGPAIVFPYIRSFISSMSSLSGFETITLPTLNLSGYREQLIKDLIDLDDLKDE